MIINELHTTTINLDKPSTRQVVIFLYKKRVREGTTSIAIPSGCDHKSSFFAGEYSIHDNNIDGPIIDK